MATMTRMIRCGAWFVTALLGLAVSAGAQQIATEQNRRDRDGQSPFPSRRCLIRSIDLRAARFQSREQLSRRGRPLPNVNRQGATQERN